MKTLWILAAWAALGLGMVNPTAAGGIEWHFDFAAGVPNKLVWQTELGPSYYLFQSEDLKDWSYVPAFPQPGTGGWMEHEFTPGDRGFFKIIPAPPAPEGFALIPSGTFQMGDQSDPLVGDDDEIPVHSVYVSAFYMAKYEVTKPQWEAVRAWALTNGYTDLPAAPGDGKPDTHPVHSVNWYAVVKWCNARSEQAGLVPAYYTDGGQGTIYKTGQLALTNGCVKWTANGYRLPTEAEWEKAARGGLSGRNFPWGNTISHTNANFWNDGGEFYQTGSTGPYPNDGNWPYTTPVGIFAPNGYGLYDMTGNVWEWCWDGRLRRYYDVSPGSDPHGPDELRPNRVIRGGSFRDNAQSFRVAYRSYYDPANDLQSRNGIRLVCSAVP